MQRSAKLIDDTQFIAAQEMMSSFPYRYYTDLVPNKLETERFPNGCPAFPGGCKQFAVNARAVNDYPKVAIPSWTRDQPSASTELYGGPFKARGDGVMQNPDSLSNAWTPSTTYNTRCAKRLSEVTYDTWTCLDAPLSSDDAFPQRGGISTRMGLQYIGGC